MAVKPLHKDFRRVVYPRSMGHPEQNKDEWRKELTGTFGLATGFDVGHSPATRTFFPQLNLLCRRPSILL